MEHTKQETERLTSTNMGPFDMITAVTERSMNSQLQIIHRKNANLQKILLTSPDPHDEWSSLDATLSAPTVQLDTVSCRIVLFTFNIKAATLKYLDYDKKGRKVDQKSCEISDLKIALFVNLFCDTVDFRFLSSEVQKRLAEVKDYSINQLLINFETTSLAQLDPRNSNVSQKLRDAHSRAAAAQFNIFIGMYLDALAKDYNAFVLHYIPLMSSGTDQQELPMPSILPSNLALHGVPFVKSATDINEEPLDYNPNHMLLFLQMTEGVERPGKLSGLSGNWVVPPPSDKENEQYDGTVALSKSKFLDGWLLKKLAEFNRDSTWRVDAAQIHGKILQMKGHLGWSDAPEGSIQWNPIAADTVDQWAKGQVPGMTGDWYKYEDSNMKEDNGILERVYQKATTLNYCFIPEGYSSNGKCEILVMGNTQIEFYVGGDLRTRSKLFGSWSTKLVLDGVNDGELLITAEEIVPKIDKEIHDSPEDINNLINAAEAGLKNLNMTSLLSEMTKVFCGGWNFLIPGSADVYISKAVFNSRKDLLCELKYREL